MNDKVNSDGNLFGRIVALILIAGVAFAAHRIACGGACFMKISCCPTVEKTAVPAESVVAPVEPEAAPVETPKAKPKVRKPVEKPLPLETGLPAAE